MYGTCSFYTGIGDNAEGGLHSGMPLPVVLSMTLSLVLVTFQIVSNVLFHVTWFFVRLTHNLNFTNTTVLNETVDEGISEVSNLHTWCVNCRYGDSWSRRVPKTEQ